MDENKIKLPIRSALIPNYYQNFHCLAQDCKDTCCIGWSITFNKKDYLHLRRLSGPDSLKEKLEKYVVRERKREHEGILYGKFDLYQNSGRCPFLAGDGLCDIQRSCGGDALPFVCRNYPRREVYTAAAKEYSLTLSCEGVLQQLWDLPSGVEFVEDPLPKAEIRAMNLRLENEARLTLYYAPIRALFIDILQDRGVPLTQRLLYLGLVVQRMRDEDWTEFDPDAWAARTPLPSTAADLIPKIAGNRNMYLIQNLNVLNAIFATEKQWPLDIFKALGVTREASFSRNTDGTFSSEGELSTTFSKSLYEEALERFRAAFSGREYFFENMMVAAALYLDFPHLSSKDALWKSYVSLCSLYSFYRFVSVLGCREDASKDRLFHMVVMVSRATLHNRERFNGFQEELFQHESSSLAHMAILLNG